MSVRVSSEVWSQSRSKGTARLVLLAIADQAHDDGVTWLGIDKLVVKTNASDKAVRDGVQACVELGELEVRKARRGRSFVNVYRVTVGRISEVDVDYSRLPFELVTAFSHPVDSAGSVAAFSRRNSPGERQGRPVGLADSPGEFFRDQPVDSSAPSRARDSLAEPSSDPSDETSAAAAASLQDLARLLNSETRAATLCHELDQLRPPARVRHAALVDPERALAWIETTKAEARTNPGHFFVTGMDSDGGRGWPSQRGDAWVSASRRRDWATRTAPMLDGEHVDLIIDEWQQAGRVDQIEADQLRELAAASRGETTIAQEGAAA